MSTNFYARSTDTPTDDEGLHIGQRSGGWEFLFRAHPERGLTSSAAWREFLSQPGVRIVAESGYEVTLDEFWPDAVLRPASVGGPLALRDRFATDAWGPPGSWFRDRQWRDGRGCPFADYEFS